MSLNRSVLVVVDMQNGFISEHSRSIIDPVHKFTSDWLKEGGDVVFTRFFNTPDSAFERLIGWTRLQGPPETEIVDELQGLSRSESATVIDKYGYSMLSTQGLELVKEQGWTDLVIVGIATESCVVKTAVDAFEYGLTPWIVTDAVASAAGSAAHEAGLLVARRFIGSGQLRTASEIEKHYRET